ncbi:MAG: hypothetical protein FP827_04300, partial [Candidatus Omnitrophica bacterium]|nr:hypothetical protein [Candidatus Omnitrophota bacterium]
MKQIILLLFIFANTLVYSQEELFSHNQRDFSKGLDTKHSENLIGDGYCTTADNILFDEGNGFKTRGGITAISSYPVAGKTCQALWSLERSNGEKYFIGSFEDALYYTITKTEWVLIRSGLSWRLNPLQATVYNDKMFFTNGIDYVFYFDGNTYNDKLYGEIELDTIRGKYICSHNNKLFFGNFYDNASKIRYNSDGSDPTLVASYPEANYEFMGYEDGDILMGLHSSRNALIGTKKYSLWGLFGHNYTDWGAPQRINNDYGVFSAQTLQDDKGMVNFLSNKGVIAFNGSSCQKIDMAVEDEFLDCENLKGEYYYWQNTNSVDWNAGTSTGVKLGSQEIYLTDMKKVWSSSSTYPTAFSSGTFSST